MSRLIIFFIISFIATISAQQFSINGIVKNKSTNESLSYANVRVDGTTTGMAANLEGNFQLKLNTGNYKIIVSYIGFKSDTISVKLNSNKYLSIFLDPITYKLQEITVLPKENPALEIIRRTISAKHDREMKIDSYIFNAYTKGLIKTTRDISTSDRNVSLSISANDTADLKITGIIENESIGYFKKPDYYKDEIIARKQSANTNSSINILTGGRLLQNFYTNDIQFFNGALIGPIADNAIDYYYYIIEDTLAMDNRNVFQIAFEPIDKSDPGFYGKLFIADSIFCLVKLDVNLNDAANPGRIFSKINIFQQFVPFRDNIYMPIDYRIFVEGNIFGMAKFGFELNSIFYDYKINQGINDDFFDMAIVKVLPDADKKDSTFWKSTQTVPNTLDEVNAYQRIDSLEAIPHTFWDDFSLLSSSVNFNKIYSITGPLGLYSFNHVEGHTLNFGGTMSDEFDKRLNTKLNFSYGLQDNRFKTDFNTKYYFGEYRTTSLSAELYNKITDLFGESIYYSDLTSSLTSLFGKYDFRDYYYTTGWNLNFSSDVLPFLRMGLGISNRSDKNAFNNSNFSIFNRSKKYKVNQTIFETKTNTVSASFTLDFRKYIEDGYRRLRVTQDKDYAILSGEAIISNKSLLKSELDYYSYNLELYSRIFTSGGSGMYLNIKGFYSDGPIPYQIQYALPGNIEGISKQNSFRTLRTGDIYGDKGIILNLRQNFNDDIFRFLKIPFIKDWQMVLTGHFNAALVEISDKSKMILPYTAYELKNPLYEIGFGIGQVLLPFSLEFTWRLNYREHNGFVISLNSLIF